MTKRFLVTGADGFIGSHVVEGLLAMGHSVRAMALYDPRGRHGWLDDIDACAGDIETVSGDIRDRETVFRAVENCDAVLHLAALVGIPYSYVAPESYLDTNIQGTLNVLQAVRSHGTAQLVCTSTSEVYGTAQFVPITEDHPLNAQSPYAATKIAADQLALSYHRSFGTPVAIARPFNTYGPRQSARAVIPTIINQIASGARSIKLGALTPTRDFSFVKDTARGLIAAATNPRAIGEVINLGSAFEISIQDTATLIAQVMGVTIKILRDEKRIRPNASEVERLFAANAKAKALLDWEPKFGGHEGLARGIETTAAWFAEPDRVNSRAAQEYAI